MSAEAIEKVRFITPNETEFNVLQVKKMRKMSARYYKIMVTAGSKGVYYHDGKKVKLVPANEVTPVDTTGAGDTFNGALLSW
ncbi:MAG: PfkB family carbohydrate kinase [Alkalibacterium sp.]|nr:PfkB family carbohydrate kinase [Alkalibacterium sp.]